MRRDEIVRRRRSRVAEEVESVAELLAAIGFRDEQRQMHGSSGHSAERSCLQLLWLVLKMIAVALVLGLVLGLIIGWGSVEAGRVNSGRGGLADARQTSGLPSREPDPSSHVVVPHAE
jgi:hypothetical protein